DAQGRASASLRAGKAVGISVVRADFSGNTSSPATFDLETIARRGDKQTSVSGLLLDLFSHRFVSFEPALPFKLPNTDELDLHTRVLIMRYDSGKGRWVKEGMAHVSDDALEIENDDGDGIRGGGWYAFPAEFTRPELTFVDYLQIEGNPQFEGAVIINT